MTAAVDIIDYDKALVDLLDEGNAAWISGRYRYWLSRRLDACAQLELGAVPEDTAKPKVLVFVMLNPSTADAKLNDPTLRRCIGFGNSWGFSRLLVVNLYALRSSNPGDLLRDPEPVGPENDAAIRAAMSRADLVVCGWGRGPLGLAIRARVQQILPILPRELHCLVRNNDGSPMHPLYTEPSLRPIPFFTNNKATR